MSYNISSLNAIVDIGENSDKGVVIYDVIGEQIVYANAIASEITGLKVNSSLEDIRTSADRVIPDDQAYFKNESAEFFNDAAFHESEFRMQKNCGGIVHISCSAYTILNKMFIVLFINDITRSKEHENYLLEFGMKQNMLLDTIQHQTSGALVLMKHLSIEAAKYVEKSDTISTKRILHLLNENSQQCIDIITDLLLVEHARAPHVFVKTSRFNIVDQVDMLFQYLRESYKRRTFTLDYTDASVSVTSDALKFLQIINIFISNAIKFTKEDQGIVCAIEVTPTDIVISIVDHGIGIPESLKPFVFDKNTSAGRTGLNGEPSVGLGLSISKALANTLHGKTWFTSEELKGSTFFVSIPMD